MLKLFSIYDGKIRSFMRPFLDAHTGSALRSFEQACKEPTSPFAQFPADFVLYEVGTFNEETGETTSYSPKIQLAAAIDYVRQSQAPSQIPQILKTQNLNTQNTQGATHANS